MQTWNPDLILPLILKSGALALEYFEKASIELKPDKSLVTEADLAVERGIREVLERPEEGVFVVGEESIAEKSEAYVKSCLSRAAYVVDPIDGTTNYANGLEMWGVSIGYMENGSLVDGAIYLPILRELFITVGPEVHRYEVIDGQLGSHEVMAMPRRVSPELGIVSVTQMMVKRNLMGADSSIHSCGAAVYGIVNVLKGRYLAYFGRLKLWDVAAGLPMLQRLGLEVHLLNSGKAMDLSVNDEFYRLAEGEKNRYSVSDIMVMSHPGDYQNMIDLLQIEELP